MLGLKRLISRVAKLRMFLIWTFGGSVVSS